MKRGGKKKGGIIAAIIIIILFICMLYFTQVIKDDLATPQFKVMKNFKFQDWTTDTYTYVTAELNVTNAESEWIRFQIIYNNSRCDVFYLSEKVGSIYLDTSPWNLSESDASYNNDHSEGSKKLFNTKKIPEISTSIDYQEIKTIYVLFELSNENLSNIFYNHVINNHEQGKINFHFNFSIQIFHPFDIIIPIDFNAIIDYEVDIMTDFLNEIKWNKYHISFQKYLDFIPGRFINRNISIYKSTESNMIYCDINKNRIHAVKKLVDIYIGEDCFWVKDPDESNIGLVQEVTLYAKPWKLFLMQLLFPMHCKLTISDNEVIGSCTVDLIDRDYTQSSSKIIQISSTLYGDMFGTIINKHIENKNVTQINITDVTIQNEKFDTLGKLFHRLLNIGNSLEDIDFEIFRTYFNISDTISEVNLEDCTYDMSKAYFFIFFVQMLLMVIIINTIIVVIILYFAFWRKHSFLIFDSEKYNVHTLFRRRRK